MKKNKKPLVKSLVLLAAEGELPSYYLVSGNVDIIFQEQFDGKEFKKTGKLSIKGTIIEKIEKEKIGELLKEWT